MFFTKLVIISGIILITEGVPVLEIISIHPENKMELFEVDKILPEYRVTREFLSPEQNKVSDDNHHYRDRRTRSTENLINPKVNDDLETAAGTNLIRPLFVYRQQQAYRALKRAAEARRSAAAV